jgi:cytochrome d ubiquinol oxidase subunit II
MAITDWPFYINFAVFTVFLTLFITELMGGLLLLLCYDSAKKKVLPYIVPIWEVTGTFAAFWVVTADFAYPALIPAVAALFPAAIIVFLIFLVARNSSISFAEFILKRGWLDEKKLYQAYGVSTLLIALVVLMILSTIVSGAGINLSPISFSFGSWIATPAALLYLLGVVIIVVGLGPVFYDLEAFRRLTLPLTTVGVLVEVGALALFSRSFLAWPLLLASALTVLTALLYQRRRTAPIVANKVVFAVLSCVIIFSLNYLVYPKAFVNASGGPLSVNAVTTTGPMVGAFDLLSVAGAVIVGLLMVLYMLAANRSGRAAPGSPAPSAPAAASPKDP